MTHFVLVLPAGHDVRWPGCRRAEYVRRSSSRLQFDLFVIFGRPRGAYDVL
jgi:hypothetical protein